MLLFTSGSTGHSKAVEYTHRQLITSVRAKQQLHNLDSGTNFMSWVSFDHSANFCELHLNAMNVGANQCFLNAEELVQQPEKFYGLISKYGIGYTFSPNSFLAAANRAWEKREQAEGDFSRLKVLMVGGEANKVSTLQQADKILRSGGASDGAVKAAYGLSEVGITFLWFGQVLTFLSRRHVQLASTTSKLPSGTYNKAISLQQWENIFRSV